MTDREINEAIACYVGWKPTTDGGIHWNERGFPVVTYPNYCNDLNAMHGAEKVLDANQGNLYRKLLTGLTNIAYVGSTHPHMCYGEHATASQRAEAFLRTIGKWRAE